MLKPLLSGHQPRFNTPLPLSLYIHIPWCIRKCPYCDFNSHESGDTPPPESAYVDALVTDLENDLPLIWGRTINTLFIGGGTPSLFSARSIENLLSQLRARLRFGTDTEITLEANPGAVDAERFREFRAAGINRLSIGIQSFDDGSLRKLGRIHTGQQARHAVELAQAAGFENINLDLMFALPEQTPEMARRDLQTAIELQPEHISYYQLTIEPNTPFYHQPPPSCDDDLIWKMQEEAKQLLAGYSYTQYEVSAYARQQRCRHNLNYWQFGDYLGIGAGAHSKLTDPHTQSITRLTKVRHPRQYLAHAGSPRCIRTRNSLTAKEIALEFMMNALRLVDGFDTRLFTAHTGLPPAFLKMELETAVEKGLIIKDALHIRPTSLGKRYLNNLLELFLPI